MCRNKHPCRLWFVKIFDEEIKDSKNFKLQIIATGMHLSEEFGMSYREIEKDGLKINSKIDCLLSSDSESAAIKSIGLGLIGFARFVNTS